VALGATLERTRALAAEAERATVERELETERAAALERQRIARELHDLLANSLSVMIVQPSPAAELVDTDPDAAAAAVGEVARAGRTALGEIGVLLRLVQGEEGSFGVQPQHGVADLPALADEYERAGLGIDLEVDGVASRLPVGVELSTYRIKQEALTNALKHAPGSPVRIRLARAGTEIAIEVRNGPAAATAFAVVPRGHGLVGLRERCLSSAARSTPPDPGRRVRPRGDAAGRGAGAVTSVVLADDQELERGGRRALLEAQGVDVLAEAEHGRAAVEASLMRRPDVLVMDIRMPVMDGITATREVVAAGLRTRVLILTTYDLDEYVYEALRAGAAGFMLKATPADRLVDAIDVVAAGEALLAPASRSG
jgi:CheY-like chemotaxis protein